jgi:hypothetical protein
VVFSSSHGGADDRGDEMTKDSQTTISHAEARKIAQRFIDGHFGNPDCVYPTMSIPARDSDDDIRLMAYIDQQEASHDRI